MSKRITAIFILFLICFTWIFGRIYFLTALNGVTIYAPFAGKREIEVSIYKSRGKIYDCNLNPFTEAQNSVTAVVDPKLLDENGKQELIINTVNIPVERVIKQIEEGRPFSVNVKSRFEAASGIEFFDTKTRYEVSAPAAQLIGYIGANGEGADGIEKIFNDYLSKNESELKAIFVSDAIRRAVSGLGMSVQGDIKEENSGVVLTIDKQIQEIAEKAADKRLKKGAILISDVNTGEIKAIVSRPSFNPYDINSAVANEDSPLLNRALMPYNAGSCFKIVTTAAALENGYNEDFNFFCPGYYQAGINKISCFKKGGHGKISMTDAFAYSCNAYFCNLANKVGEEKVLEMANRMGFGQSASLYEGISSASGILPTLRNLSAKAALANFAIGQGELLVTPVQMLSVSQMIANGGIYRPLSIVRGIADENLNLIEEYTKPDGISVLSPEIAQRIKSLMINSVEVGTSKLAKPFAGGAGAKTASAETGIIKDDKKILQAWITGFFPAKAPRYAICVLYEDGVSGGQSAAPIFKEIADNIIQSVS